MPERSYISQSVQIGPEVTEGTAVAADTKLTAISFAPSPNYEFSQFRRANGKFLAQSVLSRQWSTFSMTGFPSYTDLVYPLSMLMGAATITTPAGATNARQWAFEITDTGADPAKSMTIEYGDANIAERIAGAVLNSFNISFNRTGDPSVGGDGFGRAYETGQTLTATPTEIARVPIMPGHVSVYVDASAAALGTTKLTRAFNAGIAVGGRFSNFWVVDAAQDSYAATLEGEIDATVDLGVMADSTGMAFLSNAQNGDTRFVRIEAVSPTEIDSGVATSAYRLTIDCAMQFSSVANMANQDGAVVLPYTGAIVHDATWGKALTIQLVNDLTAL